MQDSEGRMSILAHLGELRKRLLYSVVAIAITFTVCFNYSDILLKWLQIPLTTDVHIQLTAPYFFMTAVKAPIKLVFLAPGEAFWMYMKIGFVAGIFLALPFILTQVWLFISPGLLAKEKKYVLPFVVIATTMFVLGALFCQYIILPFAIRFLLTYQTEQLTPMISVGNYVDFCSKFLLAFGAIFELPIVITLLAKLGLVTPQFLAKNRKYAILIAFVVAAILTPTPDAFNQCLMAGPILLLFEAGILMARIVVRKKALPEPEAGSD